MGSRTQRRQRKKRVYIGLLCVSVAVLLGTMLLIVGVLIRDPNIRNRHPQHTDHTSSSEEYDPPVTNESSLSAIRITSHFEVHQQNRALTLHITEEPSETTFKRPQFLYGEEFSTSPLPYLSDAFAFSRRIIQIARSEPREAEDKNGVTKYGTYFGNPTYEWCTEFAVWCILQAQEEVEESYLRTYYPYSDWAGGCVQWYRNRNNFHPRNTYIPRRGDMIFFDYDGNGSADHTGLVTGVEYDAQEDRMYILTIEGNLPEDYPKGSIKERRLAADWKTILGYGTFSLPERWFKQSGTQVK